MESSLDLKEIYKTFKYSLIGVIGYVALVVAWGNYLPEWKALKALCFFASILSWPLFLLWLIALVQLIKGLYLLVKYKSKMYLHYIYAAAGTFLCYALIGFLAFIGFWVKFPT